MRVIYYGFLLFLIISCKSRKERILINGTHDLWRVVQNGETRSDSSVFFFRINSDNSFNEVAFRSKNLKDIDSNPDVHNWHKWKVINDSTFEIGKIPHRIIYLSDTFSLFVNIKRPQDSLRLLRVKIQDNRFTNYH